MLALITKTRYSARVPSLLLGTSRGFTKDVIISTKIGEILIHPRHGAIKVIDRETRQYQGEEAPFIVLESQIHGLLIRVPESQLAEVGVRPVISGPEVDEVVAALREEITDQPDNWSRRFKLNEQKLASGSIKLIAEVVRDISRRDAEKSVSPGEKKLLEKAQRNLVSELALVPSVGSEEAAIVFIRKEVGLEPLEPVES